MDLRADFLVIGSGIAGLRAALSLAEAGDVAILTKADPAESNTGYAQGGIAAALGADDSPELHARDTMAAGDGLCVRQAVDVLVGEGPRYVRELLDWGVAFDRDADGRPSLGREAAHSVRRSGVRRAAAPIFGPISPRATIYTGRNTCPIGSWLRASGFGKAQSPPNAQSLKPKAR